MAAQSCLSRNVLRSKVFSRVCANPRSAPLNLPGTGCNKAVIRCASLCEVIGLAWIDAEVEMVGERFNPAWEFS
jgi:hypothetical protein